MSSLLNIGVQCKLFKLYIQGYRGNDITRSNNEALKEVNNINISYVYAIV